jgi:dynein heavy chain
VHDTGDLNISVSVLYNYLEANTKVPWEDLRYLFGEIMYGGHITDDWDRRLCISYLEELMQPELVTWLLHEVQGENVVLNFVREQYVGPVNIIHDERNR